MPTVSVKPGVRLEVLGPVPIIKAYLDRLKIVETIDRIVPKAPQSPISHGECVIAILVSVLQGDHRLCYVEEKLRDYDLEKLFGRKGIEPGHFNDTRLGVALDALFSHTGNIYGSIVCVAIREFGIRAKRFHVDTTTVVLQGLYQVLEVLPALREPTPNPAFGYSKDNQPGLLQLMFGMVCTDEGIPVLGRFENGNGADTKLFRNYMAELAERLEELRSPDAILVGDCKLCTIDTLAEAAELGFPLITLAPENFSWKAEFVGQASKDPDLPLLLAAGDDGEYRGKSWKFSVLFEIPGRPPRTAVLRCLAVYSSQLAKKKQETRIRSVKKELTALNTFATKIAEEEFATEAEAQNVVTRELKDLKAKFHAITFNVSRKEVFTFLKKVGRPSKTPLPPVLRVVYQVGICIEEIVREKTPFDPDGFFVLVTSVIDHRKKSDAQLLEAYKGQHVVETNFRWLKGPLAVAPVFLELPSRIQSLGFVLLLAILFSVLLQRDARKAIKRRGGKVPNYPGRRSDTPTWQGILALFESVRLSIIQIGEQEHKVIHRLDANQIEILNLLGIPDEYEKYSNAVYK